MKDSLGKIQIEFVLPSSIITIMNQNQELFHKPINPEIQSIPVKLYKIFPNE